MKKILITRRLLRSCEEKVSKIFSDDEVNAAIIAPTIITDDIALVTDINGVCNDGVTLQTT